MAALKEISERVPVQPLHESVRERVEPEYRRLHDEFYQYEDVEVKVDELSRAAPSKFAGISSALAPVASTRDLKVGGYSLRIYEPDRDLSSSVCGVIVYLHGGGWCNGNEDSEQHIPTMLCQQSGDVVVSVAYRLAPEYPYPTPVDDCFDALVWVWSNCEAELKADRNAIILVGQSAGGNLALTTGLLIRRPIVLLGLVAIAAPCDNTATPESGTWMQNEHAPVPTRDRDYQFQQYYVGVRESATWRGEDWGASPLLAPREILRNLPKTLLLVPGVDIYYAENIELGRRLQEVGVDVHLKIYPRAVHPFMSMDRVLPSGQRGMKDLISFVKQVMDEYIQRSSEIRPQ